MVDYRGPSESQLFFVLEVIFLNVWLEIFGYVGTALIIISMMMTSVIKLRLINMCGSLISLIYALICATYPVAVLNLCLFVINMYQAVIILRNRAKDKAEKVSDTNG
ncbi:MAG: YgjV family protein [Clostridia bacterium]|nr:YgjV family protein [Clostridia bacterium]